MTDLSHLALACTMPAGQPSILFGPTPKPGRFSAPLAGFARRLPVRSNRLVQCDFNRSPCWLVWGIPTPPILPEFRPSRLVRRSRPLDQRRWHTEMLNAVKNRGKGLPKHVHAAYGQRWKRQPVDIVPLKPTIRSAPEGLTKYRYCASPVGNRSVFCASLKTDAFLPSFFCDTNVAPGNRAENTSNIANRKLEEARKRRGNKRQTLRTGFIR